MNKLTLIHMLEHGTARIEGITLNDYSEYDPDRCHDGGCYGFWETYIQTETCSWVKTYGTTASLDIDYCPCCGCFYNTAKCNQCDGTFEHVTINELIKIIENFDLDDEHYIDIIFKTHERVQE